MVKQRIVEITNILVDQGFICWKIRLSVVLMNIVPTEPWFRYEFVPTSHMRESCVWGSTRAVELTEVNSRMGSGGVRKPPMIKSNT